MAKVELIMPKMGESIMEATIIRWTKKVGDSIKADDTVLEIATDKVDSEVPAPTSGTLTELLFKEGDVVPVGTVIAYIETVSTGATASPIAPVTPVSVSTPQPVFSAPVSLPTNGGNYQAVTQQTAVVNAPLATAVLAEPQRGRFYSPLVLSIAREESISPDELDRIPGTGEEGRVTKKDILEYVQTRKNQPTSAPTLTPQPITTPQPVQIPSYRPQPYQPTSVPLPTPATVIPPQTPQPDPTPIHSGSITFNIEGYAGPNNPQAKKAYSYSGPYEIQEMDRMRKMIAENMVFSKHVAPHVTSFVEADVTNLVLWRDKQKAAFEKKYGQKLTFTPIFVQAIAHALREMPLVNISVDGDKLIIKKDINVSVAVALPSGNLIVPTIRQADRLSLAGLATAVNDLTERARNNRLKPEDLTDSTYTLSNVGTFGNVMGTPIIMQPQVAVLATGTIKKKPAVLETPTGDVIAIRQMMFLSHSYDHRVIDGALGGKFVRRVADLLEAWDINTPI